MGSLGIYSSGGLRKVQAEDESISVKSWDEELSGVVRVGSGRRRLTVMSPGALMGKLVRHESRKRKNRKEGVQRLQEAVRWCSEEPEIDACAARGLEEQPYLTRPWRATATLNLWS